jgi:hypothetical protein
MGQINDMAVGHSEAARRCRLTDRSGVIRAMDSIKGIPKVKRLGVTIQARSDDFRMFG